MKEKFYSRSGECNKISCFDNLSSCELLPPFGESSTLVCSDSITSNYVGNFEDDAKQISNQLDAERFLDKLNWDGFLFVSCNNLENTSFSINETFQCSSYRTNFSLNDEFCLVGSGCSSGDESIIAAAMQHFIKYLYFFLGFFNIVGNLFVIVQACKNLTSTRRRYKEKTVFSILTLNLALADILIGIDVSLYAFYLANTTIDLQDHYIEVSLCYVLAIFAYLSNQVSVFILSLISAVRLFGVLWPFKHVKIRLVVGLVLLIWTVWIFSSILPFLDATAPVFYFGVRNVKNGVTDVSFLSVKRLVKNVLSRSNLSEPCQTALNVIDTYDSPKILTKTLENLHIVDETNSHLIGFFNKRNLVCIANPLVEYYDPVALLSLLIVVFDLLCFAFISVSYVIIIKKMKFQKHGLCKMFKLNKRSTDNAAVFSGNQKRELENQRMYRSILFIVASDLLIWVPILIASFIYYAMTKNDSLCGEDAAAQEYHETIYEIFTLFILIALPINSTINPYFYSINAWEKVIKKAKKKTKNLTSFSIDKTRTNNLQ